MGKVKRGGDDLPRARLHLVSAKMLTESKGFACMADMTKRGR